EIIEEKIIEEKTTEEKTTEEKITEIKKNLNNNNNEDTNEDILEMFNGIEENKKTMIIKESIKLYSRDNQINEDFFLNKNILESSVYFSMLKKYIKEMITDKK
ncbi:MAG: hypothetical protein LBT51_06400, partial [Fusobacteriaceae bacterium]|nr:hypothetical protein [Fusobacteriaceae bacterium]